MSSDGSVKAEDILNGFTSLQQAIATTLDTINQRFGEMDRRFDAMDRRFDELEGRMSREFLDVRDDIARLERRLRHVDDVDTGRT